MEEFRSDKKEDSYKKFNNSLEEKITLNFKLTNCKKDIYYKIEIKNKGKTLGNFDTFETELIECKEQNSEIKFSKKLNCNYYFNKRQLLIICVTKAISINSNFIYKKYERLTVLSSLLTSFNSIYERNLKEKEPNSEKIIINVDKERLNNSFSNELTIFDIIKTGINLSCYISYNFPDKKKNYNNFEILLKNFSNIILNYIHNHLLNIYGIDGELKTINNFKNIFEFNDEIDSSINSNIILDSYSIWENQNKSKNVKYLSKILDTVNTELNNKNQIECYNILFVLLKESIDINDIKDSLDIIIESSYLPLTILIIGDNENDFNELNYEINSIPLFSSNGMKKMRNNVKFILLGNNNENSIENVIDISLKEIAKQMKNFYSLIKLDPKQTKQYNYEKIKESFSYFSSKIKDSHLNNFNNQDNLENKEELNNGSVGFNLVCSIINQENNIKENNNNLNLMNNNYCNSKNDYENEIILNDKGGVQKNEIKINNRLEKPIQKYVNKKPDLYVINEEENKKEEKKEIKNEQENNNNIINNNIKEYDDPIKRMLQDSIYNDTINNQSNNNNLENDNNFNSKKENNKFSKIYEDDKDNNKENVESIFKNNISIDMLKGKNKSEIDEFLSTINTNLNKESNLYNN